MHSLAQLQERLAAAFGAAAKPHDRRPADEVVPLAPAAKQKHPLRTLLFYWLGGLGLFAAIAFLALGQAGGPLLLSAGLAILAAALLGHVLLMKLRQRTGNQPQACDAAELFAAVHDALDDITVTRTIDRRIIGANATFRRLTGRLKPEGQTCEQLGIAFRPGAEPYRFDVEISTPQGQRIFAWHDVVTRDPSNGRLLLQSVARDVTAERLAAQAREEARQKAEYNSAAKSRLLATVSHENPNATIRHSRDDSSA